MREAAQIGLLHVVGGVLGGALTGGLFGLVGLWLGLAAWRSWIIVAVTLVAFGWSQYRGPRKLGRPRQVPRDWARTMSAGRRYLVWGAMLGSGVLTLIPHSAFLVLLGAQLTAGPFLGCLSGAVYGATRQGVPLLQLLHPGDPTRSMELLRMFYPAAQRLNMLVSIGGGIVLVLASSR